MKPVYTTLVASAILAASYIATPDSANAGGRECMAQSQTSKDSAARKVDVDLDIAVTQARRGVVVLDEVDTLIRSVKEENDTWLDFPDQCLILEMVNNELADLHKRAELFRAHEADFLQFQVQVVFNRYERAVAQILIGLKNGDFAMDIAEKAIAEMRIMAFDYLHSLGTVDIRERLQEALFALIERGADAEDRAIAQHELYVKLYTIRIEAALAVLQERARLGLATVEDLDRISRCLVALQQLQKSSTPYNCGS